jgi:lysophospholipase L1-like esterase
MIFVRALMLAAVLAVAVPVEAAALNIVAIGASNTSGFGVGEQNAYPAQLQALLRKKGIDAHVTNAGVLGDVTAGMLGRLDAAVPKGTDIVILQPGANDLRFSAPSRLAPPISRRWCSACERAASASSSTTRTKSRRISINGTASTLTPPRMPGSPRRLPRRSPPRRSRRPQRLFRASLKRKIPCDTGR